MSYLKKAFSKYISSEKESDVLKRLKTKGKYEQTKDGESKRLELYDLVKDYERLIGKLPSICKRAKLKDIDLTFGGNRENIKRLVKVMTELEDVIDDIEKNKI